VLAAILRGDRADRRRAMRKHIATVGEESEASVHST